MISQHLGRVVVYVLPLATFVIAPALGIVAFELHRLLSVRWSSPRVMTLCAVLALMPVIAASATQYRPPIAVELFSLLQNEYRGRTIVGPNLGPWLANPELAFTLTGGRSFWTSDVDATPEDVRRFESVREADGSLTYLCVDTTYIRHADETGRINYCEIGVARMVQRGHEVRESGLGWALIQVNREDVPPTSALDEESRQ